jgi:prolyl-tRNA synthetase
VVDIEGEERFIQMGSYGIGVGRNMAAIVEVSHDDAGIIWPVEVAPYEVVVTVLRPEETAPMEAGVRIYDELRALGVEVLLDDRDERPGVKFADAELIGIPFRVTVGPRGLEGGVVEVVRRGDGTAQEVAVAAAAAAVAGRIAAEGS